MAGEINAGLLPPTPLVLSHPTLATFPPNPAIRGDTGTSRKAKVPRPPRCALASLDAIPTKTKTHSPLQKHPFTSTRQRTPPRIFPPTTAASLPPTTPLLRSNTSHPPKSLPPLAPCVPLSLPGAPQYAKERPWVSAFYSSP